MTTRAWIPWDFAVHFVVMCQILTSFSQIDQAYWHNFSIILFFFSNFHISMCNFHWSWSCGGDTVGVKSEQGDRASFGLLIFSSVSVVPFPYLLWIFSGHFPPLLFWVFSAIGWKLELVLVLKVKSSSILHLGLVIIL